MGEASCGNISDFCQNTQFIVTVLFHSSLTVINLHSIVNSWRHAEKLSAAARRSAFGGGVNFSAARRRGADLYSRIHTHTIHTRNTMHRRFAKAQGKKM